MRMRLTAGFDPLTMGGTDAVAMAAQFEKLGVDVVVEPTSMRSGLPAQFLALLTKDPRGDFDLSVGFGHPYLLDPELLGVNARTAVGWGVWTGDLWLQELDFSGLDLLAAGSPAAAESLQSVNRTVPSSVCPTGVDPVEFPELDRDGADRPMVFAAPSGVLAEEAWGLAREMDPALEGHLIEVPEGLAARDRLKFYAQADVLISTTPTEFSCRSALEFMATGGPVIASADGGHTNWLHDDSGYPVDVVGDSIHLAETVLRCVRNPGEVKRKGRVAARNVAADLSWEKVCRRFLRQATGVM